MKPDRRNVIFGGGCLLALGAAEALRPRRAVALLPDGAELSGLIPTRFGAWNAGEGGDIVLPETPGSLASQLYNDRVARSYIHSGATREEVMLLIAYGRAQSDFLQLHRPETCYPAIGFQVTFRRTTMLQLANNRSIPAVMLTAAAGDRIEDIIYWSRLGDELPQSASAQRAARLRAAMKGLIPDGALVRASAVRQDERPGFEALSSFLKDLIAASPPTALAALAGTPLASAMTAKGTRL
jgi:EpsI family protein